MGPGRLHGLIDGVFAIAVTLLVLDLPRPHDSDRLAHDLWQQWPSYIAYVISSSSSENSQRQEIGIRVHEARKREDEAGQPGDPVTGRPDALGPRATAADARRCGRRVGVEEEIGALDGSSEEW